MYLIGGRELVTNQMYTTDSAM